MSVAAEARYVHSPYTFNGMDSVWIIPRTQCYNNEALAVSAPSPAPFAAIEPHIHQGPQLIHPHPTIPAKPETEMKPKQNECLNRGVNTAAQATFARPGYSEVVQVRVVAPPPPRHQTETAVVPGSVPTHCPHPLHPQVVVSPNQARSAIPSSVSLSVAQSMRGLKNAPAAEGVESMFAKEEEILQPTKRTHSSPSLSSSSSSLGSVALFVPERGCQIAKSTSERVDVCCEHIARWKRLRSKRGWGHYLCTLCGARWKKYKTL